MITVETDLDVTGRRLCGVVATGHGREVTPSETPCFGDAVLIVWLERAWRCAEPDCPAGIWSESHELIARRAGLMTRTITGDRRAGPRHHVLGV